jgi:hypothetical protein
MLVQIYQSPMVSRLNHMRVLALMLLLLLLDLSFLFVTCSLSLERGPSILLLFAFEVRHCTHASHARRLLISRNTATVATYSLFEVERTATHANKQPNTPRHPLPKTTWFEWHFGGIYRHM